MFEKLSNILVPIAGKLNNNRYLGVLRDAFMLAFPLTIFGSIIVVLTNLPFLDKMMSKSALEAFQSALSIAPSATINITFSSSSESVTTCRKAMRSRPCSGESSHWHLSSF